MQGIMFIEPLTVATAEGRKTRTSRVIGTQADQKKYIGNAVVTEQAEALCVVTGLALEKIRLTS